MKGWLPGIYRENVHVCDTGEGVEDFSRFGFPQFRATDPIRHGLVQTRAPAGRAAVQCIRLFNFTGALMVSTGRQFFWVRVPGSPNCRRSLSVDAR